MDRDNSLVMDVSWTLSLLSPCQRLSVAQSESYDAGYREGQKATPSDQPPSSGGGLSEEEVGRRVKSIMNHTYQTMSSKLKVKEEFERSEVLSLLLSTIKVWCRWGGSGLVKVTV